MNQDASKTNQKRSVQAEIWKGDFGDQYTARSGVTLAAVRERIWMWTKVLRAVEHDLPGSACEIGSNVGLNLHALNSVLAADLFAIEPNETARNTLLQSGIMPAENVFAGCGDHVPLPDGSVDLSFTSGVMIHIAPENLMRTYEELHRISGKYIATIEYFSDQPETLPYRGLDQALFRRDFGRLWLTEFDDLELIDYGFLWKGVNCTDSTNWWLFRKR